VDNKYNLAISQSSTLGADLLRFEYEHEPAGGDMTRKAGLMVAGLCVGTLAQSIDITGTVTSASNGAPVQDVVVTLKGTAGIADTTDASGMYRLSQVGTSVADR
jgi:hypothetical protein